MLPGIFLLFSLKLTSEKVCDKAIKLTSEKVCDKAIKLTSEKVCDKASVFWLYLLLLSIVGFRFGRVYLATLQLVIQMKLPIR